MTADGLVKLVMSITKKAAKEEVVNGFSETTTTGKLPKDSTSTLASVNSSVNSLRVLQINEYAEDEYHKNTPDCCKRLRPGLKPSSILMSSLMPLWDKMSVTILVFICIVVAISFTIPIIIYGVDSDRRSNGENNVAMLINLDPDNCIETNKVSGYVANYIANVLL